MIVGFVHEEQCVVSPFYFYFFYSQNMSRHLQPSMHHSELKKNKTWHKQNCFGVIPKHKDHLSISTVGGTVGYWLGHLPFGLGFDFHFCPVFMMFAWGFPLCTPISNSKTWKCSRLIVISKLPMVCDCIHQWFGTLSSVYPPPSPLE